MNFIENLLEIFKEEHKSEYKKDFIVANKGKEMKSISRLLEIYKEKHKASSDETKDFFRSFFRACMQVDDKFIQSNMSPSILLSQINKLTRIFDEQSEQSARNMELERISQLF